MKRALTCASLALGLVALAAIPAHADETTFCNFFITTLPYTIATQGHYCFDRNLSTAITTGDAITINSDFVVVDLNNFKLGGGSAGLGTLAIGIHAVNHRNITVRNGNIRGFKYGIFLTGSSTTSGGHVVENNVLDANTYSGAFVIGDAVVVRSNTVTNTGGSTSNANPYALEAVGTSLGSVRDNVVANTFSTTGLVVGIIVGGTVVSDHNFVRAGATSGTRYGIAFGDVRDNTVLYSTDTAHAFFGVGAQFGHNYSNP